MKQEASKQRQHDNKISNHVLNLIDGCSFEMT